MRHFRVSLAVTVILLGLATWWGYYQLGWRGALAGLWLAIVLGIMEVSLSFDNAVVNASVLKHWNPFWQKLFLTVGILIAVFGMRLLFPLLIVAVATGLGLVEVGAMALDDPGSYARHLNEHAAQVAAFGGAFLLLVFLNFVFDEQKTLHWLGRAEAKLVEFGSEGLAIVIVISALFGCVSMVPLSSRYAVLAAGVAGVAVYAAVRWIAVVLARGQSGVAHRAVVSGSLGGFLYLEVLDASFSFDGVIGAFAVTNDVVVIMLGLAIGAVFVRSTTVYLVREGTLDRFVFLKHGAHYAIGILAVIMLASVEYHVPEWLPGLSGVLFIAVSLWSSVRYQRATQADGS
ncbi:DUF475 domain-containing protein [Pseudoduganella sp. GCM10020061]|uniref:DUF475 domain-containing protein n=1 Tax=Pseudoduganella sp. GCM10020061 TaxID=3317345 RepID=UPI00363E82C0